jgi:hypothetical protein
MEKFLRTQKQAIGCSHSFQLPGMSGAWNLCTVSWGKVKLHALVNTMIWGSLGCRDMGMSKFLHYILLIMCRLSYWLTGKVLQQPERSAGHFLCPPHNSLHALLLSKLSRPFLLTSLPCINIGHIKDQLTLHLYSIFSLCTACVQKISISSFPRQVNELCAPLRNYAAYSGNSLPTFRDNLSFLFSRVNSWKWGPIVCPEKSVKNYHYTLRISPEECEYKEIFNILF